MYYSYFDIGSYTKNIQSRGLKKLKKYRDDVRGVLEHNDTSRPEYALAHVKSHALHDTIDSLRQQFKGIEHLVLVGIGGQSLGIKAVHSVLDSGKVELHSLDTISAHNVKKLLEKLNKIKSVKKIAVCVSSKSGGTAETLVNAGVLLSALEKKFTKKIYQQTIFITNPNTDLVKVGKRLKVKTILMPESVGGRYSVTTEAGLVPLAMLGHDTDSFIEGAIDSVSETFESVTAENAVRLHHYISKGFDHYNFFAFESRLYHLGSWYRQLTAESLGKSKDKTGKSGTKNFLPSISTAVELHSVGQLYFSGFSDVYTDFVTFDDDEINYKVPKTGISKLYGKFDMQEVATALYGGVMGAYQKKTLPYRSTIFSENLSYSLGLFMGMRMLETMYVADLLNINAFNQPNVELYKNKTRAILGL